MKKLPCHVFVSSSRKRYTHLKKEDFRLFIYPKEKSVSVPIIPDYLYTLEGNTTIDAEADENGRVGFLLSSKALVQLVLNPIVGSLTGTLGYARPLLLGSINLLVAALCEY